MCGHGPTPANSPAPKAVPGAAAEPEPSPDTSICPPGKFPDTAAGRRLESVVAAINAPDAADAEDFVSTALASEFAAEHPREHHVQFIRGMHGDGPSVVLCRVESSTADEIVAILGGPDAKGAPEYGRFFLAVDGSGRVASMGIEPAAQEDLTRPIEKLDEDAVKQAVDAIECPRLAEVPRVCVPLPGSGNVVQIHDANEGCEAGYFATNKVDVRQLFGDTILIKEVGDRTPEDPVLALLLGESNALLLDSGNNVDYAEGGGVLGPHDLVAELIGGRSLEVINTHLHPDHIGDNDNFAKVTVMSTQTTDSVCALGDTDFDANQTADCTNGGATLGFRINRVIRDGHRIDLGGGRVRSRRSSIDGRRDDRVTSGRTPTSTGPSSLACRRRTGQSPALPSAPMWVLSGTEVCGAFVARTASSCPPRRRGSHDSRRSSRAAIARRKGPNRACVTQLFRLLELPAGTRRQLLDGKGDLSIRGRWRA